MFTWLRLQKSLAHNSGLAMVTFSGDDSVMGRVENDNSICQSMMASPEHARLCAQDCGRAWSLAREAGCATGFRCHASLNCFALPATIDGVEVAVLGGRAFTSASAYISFIDNYSESLDLQDSHYLKNMKFTDVRELAETAELVSSTAGFYSGGGPSTLRRLLEAHRYGRPDEPSSDRGHERLYEMLREMATSLEPGAVYDSMLVKIGELMRARRSSLMILNQQADELTLAAAVGFGTELTAPVRMKLGDPIAGAVLAEGATLVVADADKDYRVTAARRGQYRGKAFICLPIVLGGRKLGVINVTERIDDAPFGDDELSLAETMAPHLALLIDRTEWHRKAEQFQQMSLTDALTGLPNRRYLEERLFEEVERSKRHGTPLSFMIIDIDRFKTYNDLYGHTNADRVLIKTAQTLRRSVRAIDMSSRFAGDEFCIVLPETEARDALQIAERLRKEIGTTEFVAEQGEQMGRVTISIGLSSFGLSRQSPMAVIETADRALYQAKTQGRNCVVVYQESAA